jgi:galactitol-specific phosphotransferase system IIB component
MSSRSILHRLAPATVLAAPLLLAACGSGAPSSSDIQQVVVQRMQAANQETQNKSFGLFHGPYDVASFKVTNSDCSSESNGIWRCAVTAVNGTETNTATLRFKKVDGAWILVVA